MKSPTGPDQKPNRTGPEIRRTNRKFEEDVSYRTGPDQTEPENEESNRTGPNRTGPNRTGPETRRTENRKFEEDVSYRTGPNRTELETRKRTIRESEKKYEEWTNTQYPLDPNWPGTRWTEPEGDRKSYQNSEDEYENQMGPTRNQAGIAQSRVNRIGPHPDEDRRDKSLQEVKRWALIETRYDLDRDGDLIQTERRRLEPEPHESPRRTTRPIYTGNRLRQGEDGRERVAYDSDRNMRRMGELPFYHGSSPNNPSKFVMDPEASRLPPKPITPQRGDRYAESAYQRQGFPRSDPCPETRRSRTEAGGPSIVLRGQPGSQATSYYAMDYYTRIGHQESQAVTEARRIRTERRVGDHPSQYSIGSRESGMTSWCIPENREDRRPVYQSGGSRVTDMERSREKSTTSTTRPKSDTAWTVRMHRAQTIQARHGVDWVTVDEAAPSPNEPRSLTKHSNVTVSHHDTAGSGRPSRHRPAHNDEPGRIQYDDIEGLTPTKRRRDEREEWRSESPGRRLTYERPGEDVPQHS